MIFYMTPLEDQNLHKARRNWSKSQLLPSIYMSQHVVGDSFPAGGLCFKMLKGQRLHLKEMFIVEKKRDLQDWFDIRATQMLLFTPDIADKTLVSQFK